MFERMTLHGFCKAHNLPKTNVHRYCQDNDISTADGLSPEDQSILRRAFKVSIDAPATDPVDAELMDGIDPPPPQYNLSSASLVPSRQGAIAAFAQYDKDLALQRIAQLQLHAQRQVQSVDSLFSSYATARAVQAFIEIDETIQVMQNNALSDAAIAIQRAQHDKLKTPEAAEGESQ